MKNLFTQLDITSSQSRHGFSLIETIVAISILLISVTGIMNLIHQGSVANRLQADQITATYLAAEAIEFIRARRDSYWLQGGGNDFESWFLLSGDAQDCQNACRIDAQVNNNSINECFGTCPPLNHNSTSGRYGYDTGGNWEESRFTRSVTIDGVQNAGQFDEAQITVTVTWTTAGIGNRSVTLQQSIHDYDDSNNN